MNHKCDGCQYASEHQEMGFRPFGVCTKFNSLEYAEKAYNAEKCPFEKPKTNYDRIRNMSIEGMAEFMKGLVVTGACNDFGIPHQRKCNGNCKECIKQWLESEVTKCHL